MAGFVRAVIVVGLLALGIGVANTAASSSEWEQACYWTELVTEINCDGVEKPRVFMMPGRLMDRFMGPGVRGFFIPLENTVYVREGLDPKLIREITVHEMTHYILDQKARGVYRRCASEQVARMVTDLYAGRDYTSDWKRWYRCDPTQTI